MNIYKKPKAGYAFVPKRLRKLLLPWMALLLCSFPSFSQDVHFSQFYNAPLHLNPALTGVFGGDVRFMGNYRNQWSSVPVDYMTFSGAADMKFLGRKSNKGFFSGGLQFFYDQAGISKLNLINLSLSGSYTKRLNNHFFITAGVQLGGNQRSFKLDGLKFNNQYSQEEGQYVETLSNRENFPNRNNMFFNLSGGINFRFQDQTAYSLVDRKIKRTKVDVGVGFFHLNRPDQSFIQDQEVPMDVRISPYAMGTVKLTPHLDLLANFSGQFQGSYEEFTGMLGGKVHLSRQLGKQISLELGAGMRFHQLGDAFIPSISFNYNTLSVGFSYDINISDFDLATKRRGGPEFAVRYIIKKVRPLPKFKICPLI